MYQSQSYVTINGTTVCNSLTKKNVTVWSTDDLGSGSLLLKSDEVNGVVEYLVCEREPVNINFRDLSTLACNFTEADAANAYSYNLQARRTQFAFGVTNADGAPLPPEVSVGGNPVTDAGGALISGVYETTPVQVHSPIVTDQKMSYPTPDITIPADKTVAGQRFTIELRNWNSCNSYPGNSPVTVTASILVTETPYNPAAATLTFCHQNHYSAPNNAKFNHTVTHTSPLNATMTGGTYIWYNDNAGSPGNTVLKSSTSNTFNPATEPSATYRLNPAVAGHYDYWVRYVKTRTVNGQTVTCQTKLVKVRWTVRNDISAVPGNPVSSTGKMEACPDESITLSYPTPPAAATYGGNTVYKWEYSTNGGTTWTAATGGSDFTQTATGQNATITLRNAGTGPITYQIRIHREWENPIASPAVSGCKYSYTGSNCNTCPGNSTTITLTANPKPRANLAGGGTICPDEDIKLNVTGLYAKQNPSTPYYRVHIKLNEGANPGQEFDLDFNTANATVNGAVTVNPANGTATRYTIAEVSDRVTGCINTGTGTADVYKRATLLPPTWDSKPADVLCANTAYTWDASALPSVTLTGTNPPANQPQNIEYLWSAWNTDTHPADDQYTLNSGAAAVPNGTSRSISVSYRYSTQAAQSAKTDKYCSSTAQTHAVTVIPKPGAATVVSNQTVCNGDDATVRVNLTGVANSNWNFIWRLTKGAVVYTSPPVTGIPGNAAGTYSNYAVTIPNSAFLGTPKDGAYTFEIVSVWQDRLGASGCPGTVTNNAVTVTVRKVPAATLSGTETICEKMPYTIPYPDFSLNGDAGGTYSVTYHSDKPGATDQTVTGIAAGGGLTIPASMIKEGAAHTIITIVNVKQTVGALECDGGAGTGSFDIETQAAPNAGSDQSICAPFYTSITMTADPVPPPGGTWVLAGKNPTTAADPTLSSNTDENATVTFTDPGVYKYAWVTSAGCPDTVVLTYEKAAEQAIVNKTTRIVCGNEITLTGTTSLNALQPWEVGTWSLYSAPPGGEIVSPSTCGVEGSFPLEGAGQYTSPPPAIACGIHSPVAAIEVNKPGVYVFRWEVRTNCSYTVDSIKVTFKQIPQTVQVPAFQFCEDSDTTITFRDVDPTFETDILYRWTHNGVLGGPFTDNPATIIAPVQYPSVSGDMNYTISVTPSKNGCTGVAMNFTATARPKPHLNPQSDQVLCPREGVELEINPSLTNMTGGIRYEWKGLPAPHPNPGVTDGSAQVNTSPYKYVLQAASNNTSFPQTGDIGIVASVRGCVSDTLKFNVTVKPQPVITLSDAGRQYCPDLNVEQADMTQFSADIPGTDFIWTYTGAAIGFSGANQAATPVMAVPGNYTTVPSFTTASNLTNGNLHGTVTLTASYDGCDTTRSFTVDVKPKPVIRVDHANETLCAAKDASDVRYFSEIKPQPGVGYTYTPVYSFVSRQGLFTNTLTSALDIPVTGAIMDDIRVPESNGANDSIMLVVVTPTLNGCKGDSVTVELVAHPLPVIDTIPDQKTCPATAFQEVNFSSNLPASFISYYTYQFGSTNVGMGANASANSTYVPSFTAINNTGSGDITSSVSVNARSIYGCMNAVTEIYNYVVFPKPVIQQPDMALIGSPPVASVNNRFCPGDKVSFADFATQITKTGITIDYSWYLSGPYSGSIGLNPSFGSDSVPSFTAAQNLSGANISVPLIMTATSSDGCVSADAQITLTLLTAPRMNPILDREECPLTEIPGISFSANIALSPSEFFWQLDNTGISGGGGTTPLLGPNIDQTGWIPIFTTPENISGTPVTGNFMVWAAAASGTNFCVGDTVHFSFTVKPKPDVWLDTIAGTAVVDRFYCPDAATDIYTFRSGNAGVSQYRWSYGTEIGLNTPGNQIGNYIPSFITRNQGNSGLNTVDSKFIVQSVLNGCYSDTARFTVTVGPMPQVTLPPDTALCAGIPVCPKPFNVISDTTGTAYDYEFVWTATNFAELQRWPLGSGALPPGGNSHLPCFIGDTTHASYGTNTLWGVTPKMLNVTVTPQYYYEQGTPLQKLCVNPNPSYVRYQINPLPNTRFLPSDDKCVRDGELKIYQVQTPESVGSYYEWGVEDTLHLPDTSVGAPTIHPTILHEQFAVFVYPNPAANWEGYITVRERNTFGCWADTMYQHVRVITAPAIFAGNDTLICSGEVLRLNGKLLNPAIAPANCAGTVGGPGCINYEWFPNTSLVQDGTVDGEGALDYLTLRPRVRPYGNMRLTLRANLDGCWSFPDTINIAVGRTPNTPVIPDNTYCQTETPMTVKFLSATDPTDSIRWFRGGVDGVMNWTSVDALIPSAYDQDTVNMLLHPNAIPSPLVFLGSNDEAVIRYGVYLISSDGCLSDTALTTMRIRNVPDKFPSDTTEYCRNGLTSFMLDAGDNVRWYSDTIYPPNPNIPGAELFTGRFYNANHIITGDTAFYIKKQAPNGCWSYYAEKKLMVHDNPVIQYTLTDSIGCADLDTKLDNLAVDPDVTYIVNWGDAQLDTISAMASINHTYSNNTAYNSLMLFRFDAISKINHDLNGQYCSSNSSKQVVVFPKVQAVIQGLSPGICDQSEISSVYQQHMSLYAQGNGTEFLWDFGDGVTSTQRNVDHVFVSSLSLPAKYNTPDTITVTLTASTGQNSFNGNTYPACSVVVTGEIVLWPTPKAEFTYTDMDGNLMPAWVCSPNNVTFDNLQWNAGPPSDNGVNGNDVRYEWTVDLGANTGIDTLFRFNNTNFTAKTTMLKLTATNTFYGCSDTMIRSIQVMPRLSVDFNITQDNGCAPLTIELNSESMGAKFSRWFWDVDHKPLAPDDGTLHPLPETGDHIIHTFLNPSTTDSAVYHIWLRTETGTSVAQCYMWKDTVIKVWAVPNSNFSVTPTHLIYPSSTVSIANLIPPAERTNLTYRWELLKQGETTPKIISGQEEPGQYTIGDWGTYTLTQNVSAQDGHCPAFSSKQIQIVPPDPVASFDSIPPACSPYDVQFHNTSKNSYRYLWDFGDGQTSALENPLHRYEDPGYYIVTLVARGDAVNPDITTSVVMVNPVPNAAFLVKPEFMWVNQTAYTFNLTSHITPAGAVYDIWYKWDFGDGTDIDTLQQPEHVYRKAGKFDVTLTVGTYGEPACTTTRTIVQAVEVESAGDLIFPNAFRPDPNGEPSDIVPSEQSYRNYLFFPPVLQPTREYQLAVYNRWGQLIYRTTDPGRGWTGYYKGQLCPEGVYVYRVWGTFTNGQSFQKRGDILLMR
jgi:PKD repeat protein